MVFATDGQKTYCTSATDVVDEMYKVLKCDPPPEVATIVAGLIEQKAVTRELGQAPIPDAITAFIETEYALAAETAKRVLPSPATQEAAEGLFRDLIDRFGPD